MEPGGIDDTELGRRLSAGRGYRRESLREFAERVKVLRADLADWEKGEFGSDTRPNSRDRKREDAIRKVQDATGLPFQFFSIDLQRLPAMEDADRLVQVMTPSERETFEARVLEQELDDASQQSQPSGDRSEGSEPESETR